MTRNETIFLAMLFVNVIVVAIYLVCMYLRTKRLARSRWLKAIFMLVCPAVGPIMVASVYLLYRFVLRNQVDLEDVVFSKERVRINVAAEEQVEKNLIPLEEALAISDEDQQRNLMLNIVRGDVSNSLATVAMALEAKDTETSHYAASVLMDHLNAFRGRVQKEFYEIQLLAGDEEEVRPEDENQADELARQQGILAARLLEYMSPMLEQNVLNSVEQENYVQTLDQVGETIFKKNRPIMVMSHMEALTLRALEANACEIAGKWCARLAEAYPDTLASYSCRLHYYFKTGQKEMFFTTLGDLKKSDVMIDDKTLDLIRVFS